MLTAKRRTSTSSSLNASMNPGTTFLFLVMIQIGLSSVQPNQGVGIGCHHCFEVRDRWLQIQTVGPQVTATDQGFRRRFGG